MDIEVGVLAALDVLEGPAVRVGDEWVPVEVRTKRHAERTVFVVAGERDGDRLFRIRTEWAGGWLDPVVDVADTASEDAGFEPAGTLQAVRASGWTGHFTPPDPPLSTPAETE